MAWALLLLLFTLGLVLVGGLQTLQTATVLTGLPMVAVVGLLMVACVKGFTGLSKRDATPDAIPDATPDHDVTPE